MKNFKAKNFIINSWSRKSIILMKKQINYKWKFILEKDNVISNLAEMTNRTLQTDQSENRIEKTSTRAFLDLDA